MRHHATDAEVCRAVWGLTARAAGRPPTLNELAATLGYANAGSMRHRLAPARDALWSWDSSARSLRLTRRGYALIASQEPQEPR